MDDKEFVRELKKRKNRLPAPVLASVDAIVLLAATFDLDYEEALICTLEAHKFIIEFLEDMSKYDENELAELIKQAEEVLKDA